MRISNKKLNNKALEYILTQMYSTSLSSNIPNETAIVPYNKQSFIMACYIKKK